jgi:hypothetical protein
VLKRPLILSAALVAALLLAASALASFEPGAYKGITEQKKTITFRATKTQIKRLAFKDVTLCSSGYGSRGTFANVHGPITGGKFRITQKFNAGATRMTITGRVNKSVAGGRIVDRTRVDEEGKPDPTGTVTCSVSMRWAARLT